MVKKGNVHRLFVGQTRRRETTRKTKRQVVDSINIQLTTLRDRTRFDLTQVVIVCKSQITDRFFDLVSHDRLFTKIASSGVDSRTVVWIKEFLRVRVWGQLSEEVRSTTRKCTWSTTVPRLRK
jgi:hypothetical protein